MHQIPVLKAALKRGALLTAANWPLVLIQFVAESTFKILLAVPVLGGAFLVALVLGADLRELVGSEWRDLLAAVAGELLSRPAALFAFLFAVSIVLFGGSALTFLIKGGVVSVLVASELHAGPVERPPLRLAALWRASQFSIERTIAGSLHLFRRYLTLGFGLLAIYILSGVVYLLLVVNAYRLVGDAGFFIEWTVVAAAASTVAIGWITVVNLCYLLTQMIIAVDDVGVGAAIGKVGWFLYARFSEIALVFGGVLVLVVLATAISILATAGLGLISFVPLLGLAVIPLQVGAWLLRGLVFQYLGLTALGAYLVLYRPFISRRDSAGETERTAPFIRSA